MAALFSADSVGKSYGDRAVLRCASVWAHPGRITVVFGQNGCGKSTLLEIGAGLLRADYGTVHFAGRAYVRPRLHRLAAEGLFWLPHRGLLSPGLTLAEHMNAVAWHHGAARAGAVLERLGLTELRELPVSELSGGEVRRAEIAVALAREPRCLLADEPLAGVSPVNGEIVAAMLRELAARGCAVLVTGHEVPQLMEIADEVIWMVAGTTHHLGSPRDAAAHDQFRREYLGPASLV